MSAGWCWQIEHEHWINRGYVYSSRFMSDEAAAAEFLAKNPRIANEPRIVKFRSGRRARNWVGNVVAVGNASGFVEPLEATSLQVICVEASTLADSLIDALQEPPPTMQRLYNKHNGEQWDEIRDFLAVHYAFNTRLKTEFWRACRADADLAGAAPVVEWFRENGPSALVKGILIPEQNSFGFEGYLAMLVGQKVPQDREYSPPPSEAKAWRDRCQAYGVAAEKGLTVAETLKALRAAGWMK
jgi:tryptophan halogenase